ncbi:DUF58 domain-containing protein [Neptuniibacter sp.]|uniref:DUF58 domain-containing protein n=1 Tax=Neptuniibacter sp. TaxID=1962643 RepID=UPI002628ADFF|nr:DUF58 domain-containing protein [Neptuniibacter sp.]MCP4597240.1 DUF58 domain-containing protein [Neptuniibacter sp.]
MKFIPDKRLLKGSIGFLSAGLLLVVIRVMTSKEDTALYEQAWWFLFALASLVAIIDLLLVKLSGQIDCKRKLPGNLALASPNKVSLKFDNLSKRRIHFGYIDDYPDSITTEQLPSELTLEPNKSAVANYSIRPIKRGEALFRHIDLRIQSPLQFWRLQKRIPLEQSTKIFPNFMAVANLNFLDYEQRLAHIGAHISQRRGAGQEFRQLREYQRGDEIRQIDWKATSRQHRLISREYQDERDQEIIFMLDSGRRMRTMDQNLSHFDHSLNALLLTSYIALSAGDAVGFMSFAGNNRWLKPVKGKTAITTLLNNLYDLHSSVESSDLSYAAENLLCRHQKRSLIIIISNLRDNDSDDLLQAVKLLSRKHLVIVACLRESYLHDETPQTEGSLQEMLNIAASNLYIEQRKGLIKRLQSKGVVVVDSTPQQMHVSLVNQYISLKRAGRI